MEFGDAGERLAGTSRWPAKRGGKFLSGFFLNVFFFDTPEGR